MIDHTYRCIFIHQRKAAGTSIMTAFGKQPKSLEWDRHNNGVLGSAWDTRPEIERGYTIFTVVRNPFDKLISAWKYLGKTKRRSLEEVLTSPPLRGHAYRHLTRQQIELIREPSGHIVCDEIIRFEALQEGFDRVCDRIGKPRTTLGWLNTSKRTRDYRSYFSPETREIAERMFADDLKAFDYSF